MKTLTRLKGPVLGALLGALAALPIASMASSSAPAAFPEPGKMVKVIVPFVAGGGVGSAARLFAEQLRKQLGTTVIVENRVGGRSGEHTSELQSQAKIVCRLFL